MPLSESENSLRKMAARLGGERERRDHLREWLTALRNRYLVTEEQQRRARRIGIGAGALAIVAAGLGAYFVLRPTPTPDYMDDDLLTILDFTFLKEESKEFYLKNDALQDLYRRITPMQRMGTAEDSARLIAFLCSPVSGFINGQNIYVDGGLSLVWPETLARKLVNI